MSDLKGKAAREANERNRVEGELRTSSRERDASLARQHEMFEAVAGHKLDRDEDANAVDLRLYKTAEILERETPAAPTQPVSLPEGPRQYNFGWFIAPDARSITCRNCKSVRGLGERECGLCGAEIPVVPTQKIGAEGPGFEEAVEALARARWNESWLDENCMADWDTAVRGGFPEVKDRRDQARRLLRAAFPYLQQPQPIGAEGRGELSARAVLGTLADALARCNYSGEIGDVEELDEARREAAALLASEPSIGVEEGLREKVEAEIRRLNESAARTLDGIEDGAEDPTELEACEIDMTYAFVVRLIALLAPTQRQEGKG